MLHKVHHVDIAPAALEQEPLLDELKDNETFLQALSITLTAFVEDNGTPNKNWYAPLYLTSVSEEAMIFISAMCKPRAYRSQPDERLGWGVALLTPEQFDLLESVPDDELDGRLVGFLGLEGEAARYWTRRF